MKSSRALLGLALVAALFAARPATADANDDAADPATLTRSFILHVPATEPPAAGRPLVVYLHGCIQTAAQAEQATHLSELADREDFVVLYPQQNVTPGSSAPLVDGNGIGCWNWFLPEHQRRDEGEPAAIAALTRHVVATEAVDPTRVYVAGISAGADMAVILGATYPDLYAAVGAVEGCPYATCSDVTGVRAHAAMGERVRVVPMFAVQGTADALNNYAMGQSLVQSWVGLSDLADDGARNGSIVLSKSSTDGYEELAGAQPGSGDPCVRNQNWPCVGGVLGIDRYPTTVNHYAEESFCVVIEDWTVHLMSHGQPNAPSGPFTDPLGPDITTPMWEFFKRHKAESRCAVEPEVGVEPTT